MTATPPEQAIGTRVLLIDDDPQIRDLIRKRLELDGFGIETQPSAEAGLAEYLRAHCSGEPYDVIVLDMCLGAIDGRDVLCMIRSADERCAILMISGESTIDSAIVCLELGADDYLGKPLKFWDLRDRLNTALGRRRTIYERQPGIEEAGMQFGENFVHRTDFARNTNSNSVVVTDDTGSSQAKDSQDPDGEKGSGPRNEERTPGRATRSSTAGDDRDGGETALHEHPEERISPRSITPSGALIHIVSRLECRYGHADEGYDVASLLSKLGAYLASNLQLTPMDLDAVCLAAQSMNLQLARPEGDAATHRGFTCRFLRALGSSQDVSERVLRAAEILESIDQPHRDFEPRIKQLASLLLAAHDHYIENIIESDAEQPVESCETRAPDATLYSEARTAVSRLA